MVFRHGRSVSVPIIYRMCLARSAYFQGCIGGHTEIPNEKCCRRVRRPFAVADIPIVLNIEAKLLEPLQAIYQLAL